MHNLQTVISFEFIRTVNKKSFWLSVLAFPLIMGAVLGVVYFSNRSASSQQERVRNEQFSMVVLDQSGILSAEVLEQAGAQTVNGLEEGMRSVQEGEVDAFIHYPPRPSEQGIEVHARDVGLTSNSKYSATAVEMLRASVLGRLGSAEQAAILQDDPATDLTTYRDGAETEGIARVIAPGAFLVLFYIIIILLGNHMLTSTTEEKENRVIEMVLTAVEARSLIVGKIIAMVLVGALQVAVITLPVVLAAVFFGDQLNIPQVDLTEIVLDPTAIITAAALFAFSFLLFTGMLVTIGAVVPTAKEAGSFFGIAMFFMFIPLYAVMAIITDPSQTIVKVFSFFPTTAPVTLLLRNAVGNLSAAEAAIGIGILAVTSVLSVLIAVRAFRYGTLEYERKLSLNRLFR